MAVREIAAIVPVSLALRDHARDAHSLAVRLESELVGPLRALSVVADWVEPRQLAITASYEIVDETVILANATGGAIAVTLPASNLETINRDLYVKKTDASANAVTITARAGDLIDTFATVAITTEGQCYHLLSDGLGNWRILSTISASGGGGVVVPATATPTLVDLGVGVVGVSVKYAREDHQHQLDVTIDPTGANAWTGIHAWAPDSNATPIIINKTAALTSAHLFKILDASAGEYVDVGNDGHVAINAASDPDAWLVIRAGDADLGPIAWYKYDSITTANTTGGAAVPAAGSGTYVELVSWNDSSGNGNNLTGTGIDTITGAVSGNKPNYVPPTLAAEVANGWFRYVGGVSFFYIFDGSTDKNPCFTIDTAPITLTKAAGWTFCMNVRDYIGSLARWAVTGGSTLLGDPTDSRLVIDVAGGSNTQHLDSDFRYSNNGTTHTVDGNSSETIVVRCEAGTGTLRAWVNGTLTTSNENAGGPFATGLTSLILRYIGLHVGFGGSRVGLQKRLLSELAIFPRGLSDTEVGDMNTYLAARMLGGTPSFPSFGSADSDLTRWKEADDTVDSVVDASIRFGIGTDTPLAKLHVVGDVLIDGNITLHDPVTDFEAFFDTSLLTADAIYFFTDPDPTQAFVVTGGRSGANQIALWNDGPGGDGLITGSTSLRFTGDVIFVGAGINANPGMEFFNSDLYTFRYYMESGATIGRVSFDALGAGGRFRFRGNTTASTATLETNGGINSNGLWISSDADGGGQPAFDLTVNTARTIDPLFRLINSFTGLIYVVGSAYGEWSFGQGASPVSNTVLSFNVSDNTGLPASGNWGRGISAGLIHVSATAPQASTVGVAGAYSSIRGANSGATDIAGLVGWVSSDIIGSSYGSSQMAAVVGNISSVVNVSPFTQAIGTAIARWAGNWARVSNFYGVYGSMTSGQLANCGANIPVIATGAYLPIQAAASGETWALETEAPAGGTAVFTPGIAGCIKVVYPVRGTRKMHQYWVPTAMAAGGSASGASGDLTFDLGTNNPVGLAQHNGTNWQWHLTPTMNANGAIAAGNAGSITGLWQFDHMQQVTFDDAKNIVLNATTGTKIGTATTQKLGFWNVAPVIQPGPFTQTYATASHTHPNMTSTAVATTAATNIAPFGYTTAAQADDIITQLNALRIDLDNLKKLVNAIIDDGQLSGIWS